VRACSLLVLSASNLTHGSDSLGFPSFGPIMTNVARLDFGVSASGLLSLCLARLLRLRRDASVSCMVTPPRHARPLIREAESVPCAVKVSLEGFELNISAEVGDCWLI